MKRIAMTDSYGIAPPIAEMSTARFPWWLRWARYFSVPRLHQYTWQQGPIYWRQAFLMRSLFGRTELVNLSPMVPLPYPRGELPFVRLDYLS